MVSPVFKGGFGASAIEAVAQDGEGAVFYSPGAFADAPAGPHLMDYLSRRGPTKWLTEPLMPPASLLSSPEETDVSPSLGMVFAMGKPGASFENELPEEALLLHRTALPDTVDGWQRIGEIKKGSGSVEVQEHDADPSFCHVLLGSSTNVLSSGGEVGQLYELNRGCGGGTTSLTLVGVDNNGSPLSPGCGVDIGVEGYARNGPDTFNAISADGSEVFFTDCLSGGTSPDSPHQLFLRVDEARTLEISKPVAEVCPEVPCKDAARRGSAEFAGASEDGSRVYFVAPLKEAGSPLVPGAEDASNNLYMAMVGCPEDNPNCTAAQREVTGLTEVSKNPNGGTAEVQGVLQVAPDGQRVYFVARGDLLTPAQRQALEDEGRSTPKVGADNLYVYDGGTPPGTVAFVGEFCSDTELSGNVEDTHCPTAGNDVRLWSSNHSEAQTAGPAGEFLVFATYAQLAADDTNAVPDVYRYNAQTGALERVSVGEDGYKANGNERLLGSSIRFGSHGVGGETAPVRSEYQMNTRAISEDGSRIVFTSAGPLSPLASNGLANVYEWHEGPNGTPGSVALISSGSGEAPVEDIVISPNGRSVFFDATEGLVPQDGDRQPDVYDARLEGPGEAFPQPLAERRPCEGDGCQGPLTNPAPLIVPGSVSQTVGQNAPPPAAPKPKPACKRGYRRGTHRRCVKAKKVRKATKDHVHGRKARNIGRERS